MNLISKLKRLKLDAIEFKKVTWAALESIDIRLDFYTCVVRSVVENEMLTASK